MIASGLLWIGMAAGGTLNCDGLQHLSLQNSDEVIDRLPLSEPYPGFETGSPYPSNGTDRSLPVDAWWKGKDRTGTVCAIHVMEDGYRLQTYGFPDTAVEDGAIITHRHHCGTCSSLQDLAVYVANPDLTTPTRKCARKSDLTEIANCMEQLGFTRPCAETWAYNAANTRSRCKKTCVRTYGPLRLAIGLYTADNNQADGSLNDCLACDETLSGPGFQFTAGRTRRGSGLPSAIQRGVNELYSVDHTEMPGCQMVPE